MIFNPNIEIGKIISNDEIMRIFKMWEYGWYEKV